MKKIISVLLILTISITCLFAFTACGNNDENVEYAVIDATDLIQEDFGIAVTKSNSALLTAVNTVVDEWNTNGNMAKYLDYYKAVDEAVKADETVPTAPEGLKITWDFGSATETVTMYTESGFAPYEFIYGGEGDIIGLDVAIMSEVALDMGKKLDVQDVAFDNISTFVKDATGDAVGAAGMSITDERAEVVNFSNIYDSSTLVIVADKLKNLDSVADLAGLKVGVQQGTSGDIIIAEAATAAGYTYTDYDDNSVVVKASGAEVKAYQQYALAFADLKAGRIDAILMDKVPALSLVKTVG